jgi:branched-chain amino acid transport system ATP-binding protein
MRASLGEETVPPDAGAGGSTGGDFPLLETRGLTKRYDGFLALDSVNLSVYRREVRAIIGPNGAGKTTFFDLVSGRFPPTSGKIFFKGADITGLPPDRVARHGIGRAFQISSVFPSLTSLENVHAAVLARRRRLNPYQRVSRLDSLWEEAWSILKEVGLAEKGHLRASEISHGDQKLLDIAITLGEDPELLLLDEPTAGLSAGETRRTVQTIEAVAERRTLVIVEHDMKVVMTLARKISVLHQGKVIAEGSPEDIRCDDRVRQVYLTRGV